MAVDISAIKTAFKSILDTANDTAASYDLSTGMSRRVKSVNTFNPERIFPEGNNMPSLFIWLMAKKVEQATINRTMATGKRKAELLFGIAGIVYVPYTTTNTTDPADTDCEKLMENTEEVLRNNDTASNTVRWHIPADITYHNTNSPNDEEAHLRIGLMQLKTTVYY